MAIIRTTRKKYTTTFSNDLLNDHRLSYPALGIITHLLAQANNWKVYLNQLASQRSESKGVIRKAMQQLKELGYVHHAKIGFKEGWDYFVFDAPTTEEEFKKYIRENYSNINYEQTGFTNCSYYRTVRKMNANQISTRYNNIINHQSGTPQDDDFSFNRKIEEVCGITPSPFVLSHVEAMYHKYQDEIMNVNSWMKEVVKNAMKQEKRDARDQEKFEKRREWAREMSELNPNNWYFDTSQDLLAYVSGSKEWKYKIKHDLEFWKEKEL